MARAVDTSWPVREVPAALRSRYFEQALAGNRELGDRGGEAINLSNLGNVAKQHGDYLVARSYYRDAVEITSQLGNHRILAAHLESFGDLEMDQAHYERAARIWGAAQTLREAIGAPKPPVECEEYENRRADLRTRMGESAFSAAWSQGRAMTTEQAVQYALEEPV